jgi:peptide/nickel transport system substrate-binding protein
MAADPSKAGSGAFVVTKFVPSQMAVFDRAPGTAWNPGTGRLKHLEINFTSDQAARINAIRSNAADMVFINVGQSGGVKDLTGGGGDVLTRLPGPTQVALWFNDERNPQFANPKVRQALKQAVDPVPISRDLLNGDCTVDPSIYPASSWAHTAVQDKYPFDVAKAKQALADAGVSHLSFTAFTNAGSASNDIAVALQQQLAAAGIDMKVQANPTAANTQLYTTRVYESFVNPFSITSDPNGILVNQLVGGYRAVGSAADSLKPLQQQAVDPKLDQAGRTKIYGQIAQKILDDVLFVPICHANTLWLATSKVGGVADMSWIGIGDFSNIYIKR